MFCAVSRIPCPSWSRCAAVLHGVVLMGGKKLRWAHPVCAVVAHQVAVVSTYAMLGYYRVVRAAANKRSLFGWRMWAAHVILHYGPVVTWSQVRQDRVQGWHKVVALVLHAMWFWFGVGGTRAGLERVYARLPALKCWGEIGLASVVGVLTAGPAGAV